jgi:hypothetical protein
MRPLVPLLRPRHERRLQQGRRSRRREHAAVSPAAPPDPTAGSVSRPTTAPASRPDRKASAPDVAVERVREAGGPVDRAFYTCGCGCLFEAEVSTTVACPHCGVGQAW